MSNLKRGLEVSSFIGAKVTRRPAGPSRRETSRAPTPLLLFPFSLSLSSSPGRSFMASANHGRSISHGADVTAGCIAGIFRERSRRCRRIPRILIRRRRSAAAA